MSVPAPLVAICPICQHAVGTMRRVGFGLVLKRHTTFLIEGRNGGDGRCGGSLSPVPEPKKGRGR